MKKLMIASMALAMLFGCKKGENDPGISLRSRDAKMVGEWKLASFEMAEKDEQIIGGKTTGTSITSNYSGKTITETKSANGVPQAVTPDLTTYDISLTIDKDGTCTYVEKATDPSNPPAITTTTTIKGTWQWVDSKKNKSSIRLDISNGFISGGTTIGSGTYTIDMLKNKEMVWKQANVTNVASTSNAAGTEISETSVTMTFNQ